MSQREWCEGSAGKEIFLKPGSLKLRFRPSHFQAHTYTLVLAAFGHCHQAVPGALHSEAQDVKRKRKRAVFVCVHIHVQYL